jgi:hypothetical protein
VTIDFGARDRDGLLVEIGKTAEVLSKCIVSNRVGDDVAI